MLAATTAVGGRTGTDPGATLAGAPLACYPVFLCKPDENDLAILLLMKR